MAVKATGQISIVDISDGQSLSAYLSSNLPKIQIKDPNPGGVITPSWATTNLVLTPVIYLNQSALALNATGLVITWQRKFGSSNPEALGANETVSGNILTVNANVLDGQASGILTYIMHVSYTDPTTTNNTNIDADITFSMIQTALNVKSLVVTGEQTFKYDISSNVSPASITLTGTLTNVTIDKWYYQTATPGTWADYPTTADNATITGTSLVVKPTHPSIWINDVATIKLKSTTSGVEDIISIYKVRDGATGTTGTAASMAFLTNENITFAANVSGVVAAGTSIVCNVVAYTGTQKVTPVVGTPTVNGATTGTLTAAVGSATNSEIPITVTVPSASNLGNAGVMNSTITVPITSPVTTTLTISWSKVNTGATGATGTAAKVASITPSSQAFRVALDGTVSPTAITLTPVVQGVTFSKWQYWNASNSSWPDVVSGNNGLSVSSNVLTITAASCDLFSSTVTALPFKLITSDGSTVDVVTINKLTDGTNALSCILSNEACALPANSSGTVSSYTGAGTTLKVYEGSTELAYDGVGTSATTNATWKVQAAGTNITVGTLTDSGTYMTLPDAQVSAMTQNSAYITYTIYGKRANGTTFTLSTIQSFTKAIAGTNGTDAVRLALYAPNGDVFQNQTGTLTIQAAAYVGTTALTTSTADFAWYKYASGSWGSPIAGQTAINLSVTGADVAGVQAYQCRMAYPKGGGTYYYDTYTMTDKTDNYQSEIVSTAGNIFRNTVGTSCLYCNVYQNGVVTDALKSSVFQTSNPTSGTYYYKITTTTPTTVLYKYNGSTWAAATGSDLHTMTYTWYRRDKDGNAMDSGAAFATGKVIYIDGDDVDEKTTFVCEVS